MTDLAPLEHRAHGGEGQRRECTRVAGIRHGFLCQAKKYGSFLTVDMEQAAHFKKGSVMKRSVLEEYSLLCK